MAHHEDPNPAVAQAVEKMLDGVPAYRQMAPEDRAALADSMTKITGYLAGTAPAAPLAEQMAPDLRSRLGRGAPAEPAPGRTSAGQPPAASSPSAGSRGRGTTGRVGEVARATLDAIDFPAFVGSLIQGTFQAIVDASIQQMEAYAEMLRNVAGTVDQFMQEHVSEGTARDYLADQYPNLLTREGDDRRPRLGVKADAPDDEMPSFFRDLGFESPSDLDSDALEEKVVPATRRSLAERRQQLLATMVLMGMNRVVVDDGNIKAKLQFHIDASEATKLRFDQTKTTVGNLAGRAGRNPFSANGIMVNTTSLNAQSDINVRADLTGQVDVRFRNDYFPLERFADPLAIQMINQNARVPASAVAPETPAAAPAVPAPAPAAPAPAARPAAPAPTAPAAQSSADDDPWAPRRRP